MEDVMQGVHDRISKGDGHSKEEPASDGGTLPENMRRLSDAGSSARITGKCGETMEVYLRVNEDRITEATFFTNGCRFSILCGYVATKLAENRTLDEVAEIEGDLILSVLKHVPREEAHCADLAAETLRAAVHEWMLQWRINR
jgi:nitrogen fixation NifU-like protein